jgi:hypothetical protein
MQQRTIPIIITNERDRATQLYDSSIVQPRPLFIIIETNFYIKVENLDIDLSGNE